jgi:hypothetical protein
VENVVHPIIASTYADELIEIPISVVILSFGSNFQIRPGWSLFSLKPLSAPQCAVQVDKSFIN